MMRRERPKMVAGCLALLLITGTVVAGMLEDDPARFERGLRGQIVSIHPGKVMTITIEVENTATLLNLDVSSKSKVWTAYEAGQLNDVAEGQFVAFRLADDHRTVNHIHVQGPLREATIKSNPASGKLTIVEGDDDESTTTEVELAPDVIFRIGGLPAVRSDFKPGMMVPLEFNREGTIVNAIEAEAEEGTLLTGVIEKIDASGKKLVFIPDDLEEGQAPEHIVTIADDTLVVLDGTPAKATDLKKGLIAIFRLDAEGHSVRAIKAMTPDPDDQSSAQREGSH